MILFDVEKESWQMVRARFLSLQQPHAGYDADECPHARHELRRRDCSNKTRQYAFQCLRCGAQVGTNQPKPDVKTAIACKPWDADIRKRFCEDRFRRFSEMRESNQESESSLFWAYHAAYMQTARWKAKRAAIRLRCNNACEGCGKASMCQVHHLTYDHLGDELLFELAGVCERCHRKIHPHMK